MCFVCVCVVWCVECVFVYGVCCVFVIFGEFCVCVVFVVCLCVCNACVEYELTWCVCI